MVCPEKLICQINQRPAFRSRLYPENKHDKIGVRQEVQANPEPPIMDGVKNAV